MSYSQLKQNKQQELEKIAKQFADHNKASGFNDPRFWYPDIDKAGNGFAVIRFLPRLLEEDSASVKLYYRSFKGPTGKYYSENDLTTIGLADPVNDLNRDIVAGRDWKTVDKKTQEVVSAQKRKTKYISNIYVVKDSLHPEHEGKVYLFNYGVKIHGMIDAKMNPQFEGDDRMNPFDPEDGANLKIRIRKGEGGFRDYSQSEWDKAGPLCSDEKFEIIYSQLYPLAPFIAPDQFKSREVLETKLAFVLGKTQANTTKAEVSSDQELPSSKGEKAATFEADTDSEIDPDFVSKYQNILDD